MAGVHHRAGSGSGNSPPSFSTSIGHVRRISGGSAMVGMQPGAYADGGFSRSPLPLHGHTHGAGAGLSGNQSFHSSASSSMSTSTASTPIHSNARIQQLPTMFNQLSHATAMLKDHKKRSGPRASGGAPMSANDSVSSASSVAPSPYPAPGGVHLKIKRKIRKNNREKQRRSELNDKFDQLQELLQLGGGATKVEKFTVLSEAISVIELLRKDNHDLRQEKNELRQELKQMTRVLEQAFPAQPELVKDFTQRFFPTLSSVLSPQQQSLAGSGAFNFMSSPASNQSSPPVSLASSLLSNYANNPLNSPTSYLLYHQQQSPPDQTMGLPGFGAGNPSVASLGVSPAAAFAMAANNSNVMNVGPSKLPHHRRGHSRTNSSNSLSFNSISTNPFLQNIPGLGLSQANATALTNPVMPAQTTSTTSGIFSSNTSAMSHKRQSSISSSFGLIGHQRQSSLSSLLPTPIVKEEFRGFQSHNAPSVNASAANNSNGSNGSALSMAISPTAVTDSALAQFSFPSTAASHLSFGHRGHQSSQEFKFSHNTFNGISPVSSPTHLGTSNSNTNNPNHSGNQSAPSNLQASQSVMPAHHRGHQRSLSQNQNFNFNLNLTLDGLNDSSGAGNAFSVLPFDSPTTLYTHAMHQRNNSSLFQSALLSEAAKGLEMFGGMGMGGMGASGMEEENANL